MFQASGKAIPNKYVWDYSLNEAIDVHWHKPSGTADPAPLKALPPKFEIEFGTKTRRASAEGARIRGVYVGAVQNQSCFLRMGLQSDTTVYPSPDIWNDNQCCGDKHALFVILNIFQTGFLTVHLLKASKVNKELRIVENKLAQAGALVQAATGRCRLITHWLMTKHVVIRAKHFLTCVSHKQVEAYPLLQVMLNLYVSSPFTWFLCVNNYT